MSAIRIRHRDNKGFLMKKLLLICSMFSLLAAFSVTTKAQDEAKKKVDPEKTFARLDKDKDKKLTWEEFKTRPSKKELTEEEKKKQETRFKALFARMDKDKDKHVTLEEFKNPAPMKKKKPAAE